VFTLFVVSVLVFLATQVLPGNAAIAVLGRTAAGNPARASTGTCSERCNRSPVVRCREWLSRCLALASAT